MAHEKTTDTGPRYTPAAYRRAHVFLDELNRRRRKLTRQQYLTIKGQALSGDIDGAVKGLARLTEVRTCPDIRRG